MGTWVAVGDSFTVGTGDHPGAGGWIQRTATALTDSEKVQAFQNLAARGVRLDDVLAQQVPKVVQRPAIISAIAGANDILERRCDLPAVIAKADRLLAWALSHAGVAVLTCTCPDFFANHATRLPRLTARLDALNEHVRGRQNDAAGRLLVVDAHNVLSDRGLWTDDGIHANAQGHTRLAQAATTALLDVL